MKVVKLTDPVCVVPTEEGAEALNKFYARRNERGTAVAGELHTVVLWMLMKALDMYHQGSLVCLKGDAIQIR